MHIRTHTTTGLACEVEGDRAVHATHTLFIFLHSPWAWQPATFPSFPTLLFLFPSLHTSSQTSPSAPLPLFLSLTSLLPFFFSSSALFFFFDPAFFVSPPSDSLNVIWQRLLWDSLQQTAYCAEWLQQPRRCMWSHGRKPRMGEQSVRKKKRVASEREARREWAGGVWVYGRRPRFFFWRGCCFCV